MRHILLAFFSAILLVLCFPGFDVEYIAWFALVPLLIAIRNKDLKSAFGLCFFTGIIFYIGVSYWLNETTGVTWIDFIIVGIFLISCYFGLFGLAFNFISKRTELPVFIVAPFIWVSIEYARSHAGLLGFPWVIMGHSQYLNIPIIQISGFTGVYGISFLIVMVNVVISEVIHDRSIALKPIIVTVTVLVVSLVYGLSVVTKEPGGDTVNISVIQGNIHQEIKWKRELLKQHIEKHTQLTREALENGKTSLIVWPETAVQGLIKHDNSLEQTISTLAREIKTHLLFGSSQQPKYGTKEFRRKNTFNSAFMVSPEGEIMGQYNKINLLPFAEYLPYKDSFPWPSRIVSKAGNFTPGTEYTIFNLNGVNFAVLICWETTSADLFRKFVKNGAAFTVNITNESWFGETDAPYHFAAMNVFRAVENRVSLVRSANTGISCFIDPYGRIMGRVHDHNNKDIFVEGYLTKEIPLSRERTFYTKYGDIFAYMNLIVTAFMLGLCFLKTRR